MKKHSNKVMIPPIVIEGTDGSGKGTQFKKLVARLRREGHSVATFDFPQYGTPSAYFVEQYLNGRYGSVNEVGPLRGSIFYAMDRYDVAPKIKKAMKQKKLVVLNRYTTSNEGHQGTKIKGKRNRRKFFKWVEELEYDILGIPRPGLCIILHVPAEIAQKLVDKKKSRKYLGGKKRDIHEADLNHLKLAEKVYLELAHLSPKTYVVVECVKKGKLLSIDEIHEKIWKIVKNHI